MVATRPNRAKPLATVIAEWEASSQALRVSMDELFTMLDEAGLTAKP
jgi:hypothetical protein